MTKQPDGYSISEIARITSSARSTVSAACRDLKPVGKGKGGAALYSLEQVQAKLASKPEKSLRDAKLTEEIRKLKLRNDRDEGRTELVATVCAFHASVLSEFKTALRQKLENELPALIEQLDAANIRFRTAKVADELITILAQLGDKYGK